MNSVNQIAGRSDTGRARTSNQDVIHIDPDYRYLILADGVGGHKGGDVAAQMAVNYVSEQLQKHLNGFWRQLGISGDGAFQDVLQNAVLDANDLVRQHADEAPELNGMACTLIVCVFSGGQVYCASVGDSRVYQRKTGELLQISKDQTLAEQLLDEGFVKRGDPRLAQYGHVLTHAVGGQQTPEVQFYQLVMEDDDMLLVCSDGLNGMLSDYEINVVLDPAADLTPMVDQLIEKANEAGGKDNISVILAARR